MELDLWALLAVAVGLVPGMPGENLYRLVAGSNRREDNFGKAIRIIGFSVAGLVITILIFRVLGLQFFNSLSQGVSSKTLPSRALDYAAILLVAQTLASTVAGAACGFLVRILSRWSAITLYSDTWDRFVTEFVPGHWVTVALRDGSVYAGILAKADISGPSEDRDLILSEPAVLTGGTYRSLNYQHLFLPGESLASLAVVHEPETDPRITPVEGILFSKERSDE